MPRLLNHYERTLSTDFAILLAYQPGGRGDVGLSPFAVSAPGLVQMTAGTKYADIEVRLERWDGRPPPPEERWEDSDIVPWLAAEGGPLGVSGFGGPEADGLNVDGLRAGRVQVLARGRHRYSYSDYREGLPPERWLLRLWPDETPSDPLADPPRRFGMPLQYPYSITAWRTAHRAWATSGWDSALSGIAGFQTVMAAIGSVGRPFHPTDITDNWGPYTWDSPVLGVAALRGNTEDTYTNQRRRTCQLIAEATGMPSVSTFGDALEALERLGLLARVQGADGPLVPSPAPAPIWDVLPLEPGQVRGLKYQALGRDHQGLEGDILHILRWAPDGSVHTTVREVALRLCLTPPAALGALRLIVHQGSASMSPELGDWDYDTPIALARTREVV